MRLVGFVLFCFVALWGCQNTYYAAWEKLGVEKRDILVDRVENAKESQEEAQEQFASALEELSALVNFDGGELGEVYESLKDQLETSQASADEVSNRVDKIESVAEALFNEWEDELEAFTNATYKRQSAQQLKQTKRQYSELMRAMRKVEKSMDPVLVTLNDNVLYLKHNLNASAIGALQGELSTIKRDVNILIKEMNAAIKESNAFITAMKGSD